MVIDTSAGQDGRSDRLHLIGSKKNVTDGLHIPEKIGSIVESYTGTSDSVVYCIRDHHIDPVAQYNIAELIRILQQDTGVNVLCVEGASRELDLSFFHTIPDSPSKNKVARYFVEKGILTGAELYAITHRDRHVTVTGVEDSGLYFEQLAVYRENNTGDNNVCLLWIDAVSRVFEQLKHRYFSDELNHLDQAYSAYCDKSMPLPAFIDILFTYADTAGIDMTAYPVLSDFVDLMHTEKTMDFSRAQTQCEQLLATLSDAADKQQYQLLTNLNFKFKLGKIADDEFYPAVYSMFLSSLLLKHDSFIDPAKYAELSQFIRYSISAASIDLAAVLDELDSLHTSVRKAICTDPVQERLVAYDTQLNILRDICTFKLTRRLHASMTRTGMGIDLETMMTWLERSARENSIVLDQATAFTPLVARQTGNAIRFYILAAQRDASLINNTLDACGNLAEKQAVLITGGFHTEGITAMLRQNGISYLVITPRVHADGSYDTMYTDMMTGVLPKLTELTEVINQTIVAPLLTGDTARPDHVAYVRQAFAVLTGLDGEIAKMQAHDPEWQPFTDAELQDMVEALNELYDAKGHLSPGDIHYVVHERMIDARMNGFTPVDQAGHGDVLDAAIDVLENLYNERGKEVAGVLRQLRTGGRINVVKGLPEGIDGHAGKQGIYVKSGKVSVANIIHEALAYCYELNHEEIELVQDLDFIPDGVSFKPIPDRSFDAVRDFAQGTNARDVFRAFNQAVAQAEYEKAFQLANTIWKSVGRKISRGDSEKARALLDIFVQHLNDEYRGFFRNQIDGLYADIQKVDDASYSGVHSVLPTPEHMESLAHNEVERVYAVLLARGEFALGQILKRYPDDPILEIARAYVMEHITRPESKRERITYHNEYHFNELFEFVDRVNLPLAEPQRAQRLLRMAVYLQDVGYFHSPHEMLMFEHEKRSKQEVELFQEYIRTEFGVQLFTSLEVQALQFMIDKTQPRFGEHFANEVHRDAMVYAVLKNWDKLKDKENNKALIRKFVQQFFPAITNIDAITAGQRAIVMDAVVGAQALALADMYAQETSYPYMAALLYDEYVFDERFTSSVSAAPTRFEQVAGFFGFFGFAEDRRLNFILENKILPFKDYMPGEFFQMRARNKSLIQQVSHWITALKDGVDPVAAEEAVWGLKQFVDQGKALLVRDKVVRIFDDAVAAQMYDEIRRFAGDRFAAIAQRILSNTAQPVDTPIVFGNRAIYELDGAQWIGSNLRNAFAHINNERVGRQRLAVVQLHGKRYDENKIDELLDQLTGYDDGEYVAVVVHHTRADGRVYHAVVTDTAGVLRRNAKKIWEQTIGLYDFEFLMHFHYIPGHHVHLDNVHLGKELDTQLRNKGLMKPTFDKFVQIVRHYYPGQISSLVLSDTIEKWFNDYFTAHFADEQEQDNVRKYIRVRPGYEPRIMIGQAQQEGIADLGIEDWIGADMLDAFKAINNGKPLAGNRVIKIHGKLDDGEHMNVLAAQLGKVPDDEYVAVMLQLEYDDPYDPTGQSKMIVHRQVIDRAGVLRRNYGAVWLGMFDLQSYEYLMDVRVYPKEDGAHHVHLDKISLGKMYVDALRNKGIMRETMALLAKNMRAFYPGKISAVALSDAVVHWFEQHFDGHFAYDQDYEEVQAHANIDFIYRDRVVIGNLKPLETATGTSVAAQETSTGSYFSDDETRLILAINKAMENDIDAAIAILDGTQPVNALEPEDAMRYHGYRLPFERMHPGARKYHPFNQARIKLYNAVKNDPGLFKRYFSRHDNGALFTLKQQETADRLGDLAKQGLLEYNAARINSPDFWNVLLTESIGGNAGTGHAAVNMVVDRQGRIIDVGNIQDYSQDVRQKIDEQDYFEITFRVAAGTFFGQVIDKKYEVFLGNIRYAEHDAQRIIDLFTELENRLNAEYQEEQAELQAQIADQTSDDYDSDDTQPQVRVFSLQQQRLKNPEKVVVIGDVHGEREGLKEILIKAGLINEQEVWTGGDAVVVQMGDVIDRGPDSWGSFRLLRKIQQQARQAGGDVIRLIGNHELMILQNKLGYADFPGVEEFRGELINDIRNGDMQAAFHVHGRMFVHGGVRSKVRELIAREIMREESISREDVTEDRIARKINSIVRESVEKQDFVHILFEVPASRNGTPDAVGGIFWADFDKDLLLSQSAKKLPQIVGHTPKRNGNAEVRFDTELNIINVDIGICAKYNEGRGFLAIEQHGKVYRVVGKPRDTNAWESRIIADYRGDAAMKAVGRETPEVPADILNQWRDQAKNTDVSGALIGAVQIQAKFLVTDTLPADVGAYHFFDDEGHLVIVLPDNVWSSVIAREGAYHEAMEVYWQYHIKPADAPVSPAEHREMMRQVHILAAAEQILLFGENGLTPYHELQLREMSLERKLRILDEAREGRLYQHGVVEDFLGVEARDAVESYERHFQERIMESVLGTGNVQAVRLYLHDIGLADDRMLYFDLLRLLVDLTQNGYSPMLTDHLNNLFAGVGFKQLLASSDQAIATSSRELLSTVLGDQVESETAFGSQFAAFTSFVRSYLDTMAVQHPQRLPQIHKSRALAAESI